MQEHHLHYIRTAVPVNHTSTCGSSQWCNDIPENFGTRTQTGCPTGLLYSRLLSVQVRTPEMTQHLRK